MDGQDKKACNNNVESLGQKDVESERKDDCAMAMPAIVEPKTNEIKYSPERIRKSYLERSSENLLEILLKDNGRVTSNDFLCLTPERIEADEKFAKENTKAD